MNATQRAAAIPRLMEEARALTSESRAERGLFSKRRAPACDPSGYVLVVEDDPSMAEFTCSIVSAAGLPCVHVADTLKAATAALIEKPVRAAIVDWSLPDGTSALLVETLVRLGVPTVVCSASLPQDVDEIAGVVRIHKEASYAGALAAWLEQLPGEAA